MGPQRGARGDGVPVASDVRTRGRAWPGARRLHTSTASSSLATWQLGLGADQLSWSCE